MHRKAVKKGFEFTLMVVGESGLGKSTLINSMFLTGKQIFYLYISEILGIPKYNISGVYILAITPKGLVGGGPFDQNKKIRKTRKKVNIKIYQEK